MVTITKPTLTRAELERVGADLVTRLGGEWRHGRGMCRCPVHADRSPSLSVRVGDTNLLFHCFAGCETADILRWMYRESPQALSDTERSSSPRRDTDEWMTSRAVELWDKARPLPGTVAEAYLSARGILSGSSALRYHAAVPLGRGRDLVRRPAMLARVTCRGRILAVQRTFLDGTLGRRARDLVNPRRMLGHPAAGAVELFPALDILGLAEGIETALSAAILLKIPVWAVLGNERFSRVEIPHLISHLVLLPDNDRAGRRGARLAEAAFRREGRSIETLLPWMGLNDWNDVLRARQAAPIPAPCPTPTSGARTTDTASSKAVLDSNANVLAVQDKRN